MIVSDVSFNVDVAGLARRRCREHDNFELWYLNKTQSDNRNRNCLRVVVINDVAVAVTCHG